MLRNTGLKAIAAGPVGDADALHWAGILVDGEEKLLSRSSC